MATQKEIALFFQLALRLGLVDTAAVERWVDSIFAEESAVHFPFTDLVGASHLRPASVDDLLGQVAGHADLHVPGRIALALLRRLLREGVVTAEASIKHAREIGFAASLTTPLTDSEWYRIDALDDALWLAASGTYGTLEDVRHEIAELLESYEELDPEIPLAALGVVP